MNAVKARTTATETLSLGSLDAAEDVHLTAIHEAGHAVIYWLKRREIVSVSIAGTAQHRGLTMPVPAMIADHDRAEVIAAGPAAQAMATLSVADPDDEWDDHLFAAMLAGGHGDYAAMPKGFTFDFWAGVVRHQLVVFWPQLIALAEALVGHPEMTLTGAEAFAVLRGSLPNDHFMRDR